MAATLFDVGIFKDTLAPSLAIHSSLSLLAYGVGRATDRVDVKDYLWPAGLVFNTWWSAVGRKLWDGAPLSTAFHLSRPEWLLLTGVSTWGLTVLTRVAVRSMRRGSDHPRYAAAKKEEGFWNGALLRYFLPEAVLEAVIALPLIGPFRHTGAQLLTGYHPVLQALSVGVFSAGFALEALAESQRFAHERSAAYRHTFLREGVWSIVRHPQYLGDMLVHLSFPLLLFSSDMLAALELLGPVANYFFLRYVGGTAKTERDRAARLTVEAPEKRQQLDEYVEQKNSFWPGVDALQNQWTWIVVGCGAVGVALEQVLLSALEY